MKKNELLLTAAAILASAMSASGASAAVAFSDNFDSYPGQLNWVPPANWSVPSGSVDLIGAGTGFDFYPGNGHYVDLNGSTGSPGTLQTLDTFAPGTYTLTFDLGGNALGDVAKTTVVKLGSFQEAIKLSSSAPLGTYSITFTTATGGRLSFSDLPGGNGNIGNILDNVSLASSVPELSSWAMLVVGFCGVGLIARRRRATVRWA